MALTVEKLNKEGAWEFEVGGRLDGTTARQLEAALRPALSSQDAKSIVLRMSHLDFISSAGIRVLIETQNAVSARGGTVLLVDLQPQILKVLEIIKALPGISVFRNTEEMDEYLATIQRRIKSGE
jgi:anti-sigma B factor antagonist